MEPDQDRGGRWAVQLEGEREPLSFKQANITVIVTESAAGEGKEGDEVGVEATVEDGDTRYVVGGG